MQEWTTVINSKNKFFQLNIKEVCQYKDLIMMFVKRHFTVSYKQTILGPLWLVIKPVCAAIMYTIVFTNIAHISTDGAPAMLFYMMGNAIWTYFASCLGSNASSFNDNAAIFGKVYFPRLVTPISNVLVNIINFLVQLVLVGAVAVFYVIKGNAADTSTICPNIYVLLVPVLIIQIGMLGMGCGIIVSSLTTKYRDLSVLVGFGMQLWMYGTPIVYPLSQIPDKLRLIALINPMTSVVETFRYALLGTGSIPYTWLIVSFIVTEVIFLMGILIFNKVEKNFMDII